MTKRDFSKLGIALLISAIAANVASMIPSWIFPEGLPGAWNTYSQLIAFYVVLVPVALLAFKTLSPIGADERAIMSEQKPKLKMTFILLLGIFCFCMACSYLGNVLGIGMTYALSSLIFGQPTSMLNPMTNIMSDNYLLAFLVAGVLAPICEEFVFRKLLLERLRPAGELASILICGLAFGLYHLNITQFFYAAILGMIFAYITIKTGTILWSSVLHIMINTLGTVVMSYLASQMNLENPMSTKTILYSFVIVGIVGVLFIGGIIFLALTLSRKGIQIEKNSEIDPSRKVTFGKVILNVGGILFTLACLAMWVVALAV